MSKAQKIGMMLSPAFMLLGGTALATEYTPEIIASETGDVLNATVQSIIDTALEFITANLPLIVVLGVAFGMVFWLIRKAISAIKGRP